MKQSNIAVKLSVLAAITACAWTLAMSPATTLSDPPAKKDSTEMPLPPGMTAEQMKEFMESTKPGPMQAYLAKEAGSWTGEGEFWMAPDAPPSKSTIAYTCTVIMDGRYLKQECTSNMEGVGDYQGLGIIGYDNIAKEFQSSWIDSMGTGIMYGTGSLSSDQKTLSFNYTFNCPIVKKCVKMRQTITREGPDKQVMRMYSDDPATGKEFMNMQLIYTRNAVAASK